jgi:hypothetical protein
LFKTGREQRVSLTDIESKCFVLHALDLEKHNIGMDSYQSKAVWLEWGPEHFFVTHRSKSLRADLWPDSWEEVTKLDAAQPERVCEECVNERCLRILNFQANMQKPLHTLDLCSGTGALSLGMESASPGFMHTAYAFEHAPSPAQSMRCDPINSHYIWLELKDRSSNRSPKSTVYTEDINLALKDIVRSQDNPDLRVRSSITNKPLPRLPVPTVNRVDAIAAGFPWSEFSSMDYVL